MNSSSSSSSSSPANVSKVTNPFATTTASADTKPEWIRPADARKHFGLCRSWIYDLINAGEIVSKLIRKRGRTTGIRLISYDSLKAYIESQPSE